MDALSFINVGFGYSRRPVLHNLCFDVKPGEILAVVGPNGVGKSTLIKAASGILPLTNGEIRLGEKSIHSINPDKRARRIAVVPQAIHLPGAFRALDVVLMGRTAYLNWFESENQEDVEIATTMMEKTGTLEYADRLVGELSGGEQQRVLIARALAQSPEVMLLDEPTAHLDLHHQDRTLKLVRELALEQGLAVLMALHDLNLVSRFADRVMLLSNGTVHSLGRPQEVLTADLLAEVYAVKIQVFPNPQNGHPVVTTSD
ncbi:MAG: ABC transporter ATP-binding protein [Anaerolineales bacterium]|nr:ABC transporter ATP-binding protein [Anaerolineales bacterium]